MKPDYESLLKNLLKNHLWVNSNGEVEWNYLPSHTLKDFDEELDDQLVEIIRETGCE